jgi:hypothetical protein
MLHPLLDRPVAAVVAVELHEAGDLAHWRSSAVCALA